jgi:hypothetical protein
LWGCATNSAFGAHSDAEKGSGKAGEKASGKPEAPVKEETTKAAVQNVVETAIKKRLFIEAV